MARGRQDWLDFLEQSEVSERTREVLRQYAKGKPRGGRRLSRPQAVVAGELGISTRMVRKHLTTAMEAGLIVEVTRAQRGLTAVYEGSFGTPAAMAEQAELFSTLRARNLEVPAMRRSGFRGSTHYYGSRRIDARSRRRQDLQESFFTVEQERESLSLLSLPDDREADKGQRCSNCGRPVDPRSTALAFPVCWGCPHVARIAAKVNEPEEGTA